MIDCPPPAPEPWRVYPYDAVPGDPDFAMPAAEGHADVATDTYYASGFLTGRSSGRRYAFLTIFAKNEDVFDVLSADLHVLALFDLDAGRYDTGSRFDLPPDRRFNRDRINVTRGRLDVSYTSRRRVSRMRARRAADDSLEPFAYAFELSAEAASGREMALGLCADAVKPPQPVGGAEYGGRITVYGQPDTRSYFQPLAYRGWLAWGAAREEVDGGVGWLDRQWFPEFVGRHAGLLADRYGHQWAQISLDNGWEFSLWRQFDREHGNRLVPFSGLTATDPGGATLFTEQVGCEILSHVRDPERIEPLLADAQRLAGRRPAPRFFFDAFRLTAPAFDLDINSRPLVAAPAHLLPIDYFSGPTVISGRMGGQPVSGLGFHERTLPLAAAPPLPRR